MKQSLGEFLSEHGYTRVIVRDERPDPGVVYTVVTWLMVAGIAGATGYALAVGAWKLVAWIWGLL